MGDFNTYKAQSSALCEETASLARQMGQEEIRKTVEKARERLQKKSINVLICGEMKRGKSSLLGALLGEPDLFPTDVNVATNAITVVSYGEKETIEAVLEREDANGAKDSVLKQSSFESVKITRAQIRDYVTEQGNRNNAKHTRLLKIQINNEKLKTGLVFIDTPGVGSLNVNHAEITYGYLPEADVLLFVGDAQSPYTQTEMLFLKAAYSQCKTVLFPITKADQMDNMQAVIEADREKIMQHLQMPAADIELIPVSSTNRLSPVKLLQQKSNFDALEKAIWTTVYQKRSQILILPALLDASRELSGLHGSLNLQNEALSKTTEETAELEKALQRRAAERKKLLEDAAQWRQQLGHELSNVESDVTAEVQSRVMQMQGELSVVARRIDADKPVDALLRIVNEELTAITFDAKNKISNAIGDALSRTYDLLKLDVDVSDGLVEKIGFQRQESIDAPQKSKKLDRAIAAGRNISMNAMGGGALLGVVGAIIGGGLGLLVAGPAGALAFGQAGFAIGGGLGAAAGTVKGTLSSGQAMRDLDFPAVMSATNSYINQKSLDIRQSVGRTVKDAIFEINQDINQKLKQQIALLETDIQDIQQNKKLNEAEISQKRAKLQNLLGSAARLEQSAISLIYEINKPTEETAEEAERKPGTQKDTGAEKESRAAAEAAGTQSEAKQTVAPGSRFSYLED